MRNGRLALQARCLFQFHTNHMCTSMCYNRNCVCGELLRLYFPNVNLYADSTFKCSRGSHETARSRWIDIVMQFSSANSTMGTLNETWCDSTNFTKPSCKEDVLQAVGYGSVFLLGFLVNAAALRALIVKQSSWTDTHIYMLNLVIADTSLLLFLPFRIYNAFFCMDRNYLCTFLIFLHYTNMYASILTTTAISVQRYLILRFPLQARTWKKKKETACAVCCLIWGFLVVSWVIFREDNDPKNLWTCFERCKNHPLSVAFIYIIVCLGYITPLLIIVFCSSSIIRISSGPRQVRGNQNRHPHSHNKHDCFHYLLYTDPCCLCRQLQFTRHLESW
uniref:G-protein coupled receptor 35-like n=1 Tax=Gasterosteus aculeatus aculeatus TaxID=481459 RepID=UPI001A9856BF|nr:G-protein coupled receptor 35-like [Gasterosteus aculeatus aculeatus]